MNGINGVSAESMDSLNRKLINDGIPTITVPLVFDADSERDHLLWTISEFGKIENEQNCDRNLKSKRKRKRRENLKAIKTIKQDKWDESAFGDNIKLSAAQRVSEWILRLEYGDWSDEDRGWKRDPDL